jgi:6,7-dimethyl-8-ribityllumazine synthase
MTDGQGPRVVEGTFTVTKKERFTIVAGRFNNFIVDRLVDGAIDTLVRHGATPANITVVRVPGSWELPLATSAVAKKGDVDAIIAVGALIRGATAHFDYISAEVSKGLAQVSMNTNIPVAFGVLTTDTIEQAVERAGSKAGNKGAEAAMAAIEMVSLLGQLG